MTAAASWLRQSYVLEDGPHAATYAYFPACIYCGGALDPGDRGTHIACCAEWLSRFGRGMCVACGDAEAAGHDHACMECSAVRPMRYAGYPGGRVT